MTKYFWARDGLTYSKAFTEYWIERCNARGELITPLGNYIRKTSGNVTMDDLVNRGYIMPDVTETLGHEVCPLTLEGFERPMLLNINNRTYERSAIMGAIDAVLCKGGDLRLEDITLTSASLSKICLMSKMGPFFARDKPEMVHFEGFTGWASFDPNVTLTNITGIFHIINRVSDGISHWKLDEFVSHCASHPACDVVLESDQIIICNVQVNGISIFGKHAKMDKPVVFKNALFRNCTLASDEVCFCGVSFISCRFENTPIQKATHCITKRCQGLSRPPPQYSRRTVMRNPDGKIIWSNDPSSLIPDESQNEYDD